MSFFCSRPCRDLADGEMSFPEHDVGTTDEFEVLTSGVMMALTSTICVTE